MGGERSRAGQYLYLCAAALIAATLGACAPLESIVSEQKNRTHLQRIHHLMDEGDFDGVVQESHEALAGAQKNSPGDAALFGLGLMHVHAASPQKDHEKARNFFSRIEKEFPLSPLAPEARIWAGALEAEAAGDEQKSLAHLQGIRRLMQQGDFEGAQQSNRKALSASPNRPPADAALFGMGLIHIHYANPRKDYRSALGYFGRLQNEFPQSPLAEDARVWIGVLEAMERAIQIDIEIEEKRKELTR